MAGRVYSYMRFSDPRQSAGSSSDRQMAYAATWAAKHGLALDDTLSLRDEGLSAYHQRHVKAGALGTFLAAVESGKVEAGSVLVVEGLDRLSRAEPIQAQAQLAQIVNAGISVVTASDGKTYSREHLKANPMDLVYSLLVMIRAHEESDTKSKRVKASIRKQCENWLAGTFKGVIRNGKDPAWVRQTETGWELVPDRVDAVMLALDLYRAGHGATRIIDELHARGLQITSRGAQALQIYRLAHQRALLGEKELSIDGTEYRLPGYYPALLTQVQWDELQDLASDRSRRKIKGDIPGVITGLKIATCGYCGAAIVGQNAPKKGTRLPDGRMRDCHRRLRCVSNFHGSGCAVVGSASVAPIERALMSYCSDMLNLRSLMGNDLSMAPRAALAKAKAEQVTVEAQLERLVDAMLGDADGAAPAVFAKRARDLEAKLADLKVTTAKLERELASTARADLTGKDQLWAALAHGVEYLDKDARIQARQLVADTFERIVIYWRGVRPAETPEGVMDVTLLAKGGAARWLRISKDGLWVNLEDVKAVA